jgi:hypothetical protein
MWKANNVVVMNITVATAKLLWTSKWVSALFVRH